MSVFHRAPREVGTLTAFETPVEKSEKLEFDPATASGAIMFLGGASLVITETVTSIVSNETVQAEFIVGGGLISVVGYLLTKQTPEK